MNSLRSLSLSRRFVILIGVFALGFLVSAGWSFKTLYALDALKINGPVYQRIIQGKDLVADILPPPEYIIESYLVTLQLIMETDPAERERHVERIQRLGQDYETRHRFWTGQGLDPELAQAFLQDSYVPATEFYRLVSDALIPALRQGDTAEAARAMPLIHAAYARHRQAIDRVVVLAEQRNRAHEVGAQDQLGTATLMMGVVLALSLLVSIAVAIAIVRGLLASIGGEPDTAAGVARTIASGDLTTEVRTRPGDDSSLLAAIAAMQTELRRLIGGTREVASHLLDAAARLSESASQTADRAGHQSSATSAIAAAVEEMTLSIGHVAERAHNTHGIADESGRLSVDGAALVQVTIAEMDQIARSVTRATEVVNRLGSDSERIDGIVAVIKEIANQTNLLALNAAIEAARAGEQGRGFSVVADEVRKLAEKTAVSTQEIATMIGAIREGVQSAVQSMEEGRQRVEEGVQQATRAGSAMTRIEADSGKVLEAVDEISLALDEQRSASTEITQNVERTAELTDQNAAAIREVSDSAGRLLQLANRLKDDIEGFRL